MNAIAKILIVDDEEVIRRSFTRILETTDCQVKAAASWTQVVQAMQEGPADVVLLDLQMPDTDGIAVLQGLKQRWPESEVIIITGHPTIASAKEAIALGAYDYLPKPVAPEQVIQASGAAMRHKRWALHVTAGSQQPYRRSAATAALPGIPDFSRSPS